MKIAVGIGSLVFILSIDASKVSGADLDAIGDESRAVCNALLTSTRPLPGSSPVDVGIIVVKLIIGV